MSVSTVHPDYLLSRDRWESVRHSVAGEDVIKRKKDKYLPHFVPHDQERYDQYIKRAYFLNVTGRTQNALSGMVFRTAPTYEVPDELEPIIKNADGAGQPLVQLAKESMESLLAVGRHCLLADYPPAQPNLDVETQRRLGLRPVVASYMAESLINWRTEIHNNSPRLVLAVLVEVYNQSANEFEHDYVKRYRVLRLRDGVYTQQLYDDGENPTTEEFTPTKADGSTFDHIPLWIVGSQNNLPDVDDSPLYDLSVLNIAHYRNVADLEEAAFIAGQPTLHLDIGDTDYEAWKASNPDGVRLGSRTGIVTQGGSVNLVQAEDRSLLKELKLQKEQEMVKIGARLIQKDRQVETAEAARINAGADASVLDMVVSNLSSAIVSVLTDCAAFMGASGDIRFELNRAYWEADIDANTAMAIIQFGDAGIIAKKDQRQMIRSGRLTIPEDRSDDQIDEDIGSLL